MPTLLANKRRSHVHRLRYKAFINNLTKVVVHHLTIHLLTCSLYYSNLQVK